MVFLAAAERSKTSSMNVCRGAAVALHYFILVVFVWMAIQAFNMFLAFVIVMPKHYPRFMLKCCIVGWGRYKNYIFKTRIDIAQYNTVWKRKSSAFTKAVFSTLIRYRNKELSLSHYFNLRRACLNYQNWKRGFFKYRQFSR